MFRRSSKNKKGSTSPHNSLVAKLSKHNFSSPELSQFGFPEEVVRAATTSPPDSPKARLSQQLASVQESLQTLSVSDTTVARRHSSDELRPSRLHSVSTPLYLINSPPNGEPTRKDQLMAFIQTTVPPLKFKLSNSSDLETIINQYLSSTHTEDMNTLKIIEEIIMQTYPFTEKNQGILESFFPDFHQYPDKPPTQSRLIYVNLMLFEQYQYNQLVGSEHYLRSEPKARSELIAQLNAHQITAYNHDTYPSYLNTIYEAAFGGSDNIPRFSMR